MSQIKTQNNIQTNPWLSLKRFTDARIALGRTGDSLPTKAQLDFQFDHAMARDAVHLPLDYQLLSQDLSTLGYPNQILHSQAQDRNEYLQRPDLGRLLDQNSIDFLKEKSQENTLNYDLSIVVSEGLSSLAITQNVLPFLEILIPMLKARKLLLSPISLVQQGRVAVADAVAEYSHSKMCLILIGERPGLSSPDSMGLYFTYHPKIGSLDSERNCISNIRPAGLNYQQAAERCCYLIDEAIKIKCSGVTLKDNSESSSITEHKNFLLPNKE